jgi:hypothetical protein
MKAVIPIFFSVKKYDEHFTRKMVKSRFSLVEHRSKDDITDTTTENRFLSFIWPPYRKYFLIIFRQKESMWYPLWICVLVDLWEFVVIETSVTRVRIFFFLSSLSTGWLRIIIFLNFLRFDYVLGNIFL